MTDKLMTSTDLENLFKEFPRFSDIEYVPPYEDDNGEKFSLKYNQNTDEILKRIEELFGWWYKKSDIQLVWSIDEMIVVQRKMSSALAMLGDRLARYEANELLRKYIRQTFSNEKYKTLFLKRAEEKWTEGKIKAEIEVDAEFKKKQYEYFESMRYAGLCKNAINSIQKILAVISQNISVYKHEQIAEMHNIKHNTESPLSGAV